LFEKSAVFDENEFKMLFDEITNEKRFIENRKRKVPEIQPVVGENDNRSYKSASVFFNLKPGFDN